jgi:hypothetical protein
MSVQADSADVVPGGVVNLRVAITNTNARAQTIVLESHPPYALGRPDWSLLAGTRPPEGPAVDAYKVFFAVRTVDARELPTDRLPLVPPASPPPVRLLRIRVAPSASLTETLPWWALGIPAPYPPFKDDAGHRHVPQTSPKPLSPGEYGVRVEVPIFGLAPNERMVTTTVVVRAP